MGPEHAWAWESGIDIFPSDRWTFGATVFGRLDHDVIDWLRPSVADRWQTYNIRDVDTVGLELTARRTLADGSFVQAGYTTLDVDAAAVTQLSKYVLDYAPHSFVAAASIVLPAALRVAPRLSARNAPARRELDYAVFDVRVSRQFGLYEIRLEGTTSAMPPIRKFSASRCPVAARASRWPIDPNCKTEVRGCDVEGATARLGVAFHFAPSTSHFVPRAAAPIAPRTSHYRTVAPCGAGSCCVRQ